MDVVQDFVLELKTHAQEWRDQQVTTLDYIHGFEHSIDDAMQARKIDDLSRDGQGRYHNHAAQTVAETVLVLEGQLLSIVRDMSDDELKSKLDYGLDHADQIGQILIEKSEQEGQIANALEKQARHLEKDLMEIKDNDNLSEEQKIHAMSDLTMEVNDSLIKTLSELNIEDVELDNIINNTRKSRDLNSDSPELSSSFIKKFRF